MKKRCPLFLLVLLLFSYNNKSTAQDYHVQIAAFTEEIAPSYFNAFEYQDVLLLKDCNHFIRYSMTHLYSLEQAEKVKKEAINRGFDNTQIIRLNQRDYAYLYDAKDIPFLAGLEEKTLYIRSILFDTGILSLKEDLVTSLEETVQIMTKYPALKLKIIGYADGKGTEIRSASISGKRARYIQNFLLANDIPAYRLKMKISKEANNASHSLPNTRVDNKRIVLALVDLKDEIVMDNFQQSTPLKNIELLSSIEAIKQ